MLATPVLAGAPFLTDDPDTLAPGHWEFNTTVAGTRSDAGRDGVAPEFELNYGAAPDLQWHMQAPVAGHADAGQHLRFGLGDVELGVKYRFVQEDPHGWRPMVGVTPAVDLPTGDARRGLGSGHTRVALPLWVQKSVGDWTSSAGGGWYSNPGAGNRNYVFIGWLVQRQLNDHLALGAEVFHQGPTRWVGWAPAATTWAPSWTWMSIAICCCPRAAGWTTWRPPTACPIFCSTA